jgi:hypothetical protein
MKHLKNFDEMNESWRQVKGWLNIPRMIFEKILSKLIKFVPLLSLRYNELAAKIDFDKSLSINTFKEDPIKLGLMDIKNDNLRNTLAATGIFKKWNVYTFNRTHENRQPIYISKDELKKGDEYYGERISDSDVDKNYGKNKRRFLKSKGAEELSEIEPQFWVIVAKKTDKHDKMKKERDSRYNSKTIKALENAVKEAIKDDNILGRSNSFTGSWSHLPIAFKVVEADRIDLLQQLIDGCIDYQDRKDMLNNVIDSEGWSKDKKYYDGNLYKCLLDYAKSDEMKKFIVGQTDFNIPAKGL